MTTILIKKKDTAGAPAPGDLTNAAGGTEIAVNTATKRIYTKDAAGNVVELGTNASATTLASLTVTGATALNGTVALGDAAADNITVNGTIASNLLFTDATYDIGASGANRPRNLFTSNAATIGAGIAQGTAASPWATYTAIDLPAWGYISSGNQYMSMLQNAYYNGSSYVRKGAGSALEFLLQGSGFTFNAAASSTAGSTFSYSTIGYLQTSNVASGQTTLCLQNQASVSNIILSTNGSGASNANLEYRANAHSFQIGTTERLGVLNNGNIGISTANVIGAGNIFLGNGAVASGYFEPYNSVTGETSIVNTGNYPILFKTNSTTKGMFAASGKFLVGTTTERNTLTVVSGTSAGAPTIGTASGTAFFGGASALYGMLLGVDGAGSTWMQAQRVDGTGTEYDLWLQPTAGFATVGYPGSPGTRFGVGSNPLSNSYDGLNVLRKSNGATVIGLWQTGSSYTYGSVGSNASWIYSNYGNLNITTDTGDMFFSTGVGSNVANRLKISQGGVVTVLAGASSNSDSSATGLQLYDFAGQSEVVALAGGVARNLVLKGQSIAFWTGTAYTQKMQLFDNGCLSIGGTVNSTVTRLILNGETNYNDSTPGQTPGTMHFAGQLSANFSNAITWNGGTGTTGAQAGIYVQGSGAFGTKMRLATTNSYATGAITRVEIDHNGAVNIGQLSTSYGSLLNVNGGIFTRSKQFNIESTSSAVTFEWVLRSGTGMDFFVNNASVLATLTSSGVWTNASDARYKENIRPVAYGLAEVMQLQPRAYNIIGSEKQEIGFVAQEVEPILPELVENRTNSVTNEDRFTLSYGQMSAVLVKAIQELKAEFDAYVAAHP